MKRATGIFVLTYLGVVFAAPLGFYHSKTIGFNAAPAVVAAVTSPPPPPPPPPKYVDVDVVQSEAVQQVNHATGQIVGIIGNIANAVGNIVAQTVRDIGELARTARPVTIQRKTVSVPVQPVATKTISLYAPVVAKSITLSPLPQPSIAKTVSSVEFQKTVG